MNSIRPELNCYPHFQRSRREMGTSALERGDVTDKTQWRVGQTKGPNLPWK